MQQSMQITRVIKQVCEVIGDAPETTGQMFDPRDDRDKVSSALHVVPDNQRFDAWDDIRRKSALIDSVMKNYPMSTFVMSRHRFADREVYHVQDGQQRLRTLQTFMLGGFAWNGKKYCDFSRSEERTFLGYKLHCDIVDNANTKELATIFERINSGKPLSDNDKYHNMRCSNILSYIFKWLIVHPELAPHFAKLVGPIGTGKTRALLKDIVGAVVPIIVHSADCIRHSYDVNGFYLEREITEETSGKIFLIFKEYFEIIVSAFATKPPSFKVKKNYGKLNGMLGLFVYYKMYEGAVPHVSRELWEHFARACQDAYWQARFFSKVGVKQNDTPETAFNSKITYLSQFNDKCSEEITIHVINGGGGEEDEDDCDEDV